MRDGALVGTTSSSEARIHANLPFAIHTAAGTQIERRLLYRTTTLSAAHAPGAAKSGPRSVTGARGVCVCFGQWTLQ